MSQNYQVKQHGSGGMSGQTPTPANSHLGNDKPSVLDAEGAIGKQFTGRNDSLAMLDNLTAGVYV